MIKKTKILSLGLLLSFVVNVKASDNFNFANTHPVILQKNFFFLKAVQENPEIKTIVENDKVFKNIADKKTQIIKQSIEADQRDLKNIVGAYLFNDKEIESVSNEFVKLVKSNDNFHSFVKTTLRPSLAYADFDSLSDEQYISQCWKLCAMGMNNIMNVYGLGKHPMYAGIDSVSYDVNSKFYISGTYFWSSFLFQQSAWDQAPFFMPSVDFSMALLYQNHRDEAARYEPMEWEENKKAIDYISNIDFDKYEYAAILVLGCGPETYTDNLSSVGKLNLLAGVTALIQGKAPLIIVSGGHVHPYRTKFAEAIEMKKELMDVYHIPEEKIIIEPHARHTTTNFRNASRLIYKYNIPTGKKCIAASNNDHISYVCEKRFKERCDRELGYLPVTLSNRISSFLVEFTPDIKSFQENPLDPLDP